MEASVVVWRAWTQQIKALVPWLHGHQCRARALLTLGLVRAGSVRLPVVGEALAPTSAATLPSIERRLARVLANPRLPVGRIWAALLPPLLAGWRAQAPTRGATLVLDLTPIDQRASVVYLGLLIQTRLLPLAWQVLPGATPWPEPQWDIVARLLAQVAPSLRSVAWTLVADRGLSGHPLVNLCGQQGWHYVLRLECSSCCQPLPSAPPAPPASALTWQRVDTLVRQPGQHWYGAVRVWKEQPPFGSLSAVWAPEAPEPWYLPSDLPAGAQRVATYRLRRRVEATFQDTRTRDWDLEGSRVTDLARLERLLLGLALALWWTTHLAAACLHHRQRRRLDRADRRDKGLFRLGRQWAAHLLTRPPSRQTALAHCFAALSLDTDRLAAPPPLLIRQNVSGRELPLSPSLRRGNPGQGCGAGPTTPPIVRQTLQSDFHATARRPGRSNRQRSVFPRAAQVEGNGVT